MRLKLIKSNKVFVFFFYSNLSRCRISFFKFSRVFYSVCLDRSKMVAANRLFPHVSTIETETQIHLRGFSRTVEDLWADFGFEIRKSETRCNFNARSSEESSSSRRIQR